MPTCADIFCGAGGLTHGFASRGFNPTYAVDVDPDCSATFTSNFGDVALATDISDVDFRGIQADVVLSGLPCQGFSPLGRRLRKRHAANGLWRHFYRALRVIRPAAYIVECVPGFLSSWAYRELRRLTRKLGYPTSTAVLDAAHFAVPQHRRRAFVAGIFHEEPLRFPRGETDDARAPTVRNAIGDLPHEISGEGMDRTHRPGSIMVQRMKHVPPGGSRFDVPKELLPECWRKNSSSAKDVFGRLRWDAPSVTIRTCFLHMDKGRYIHPEANRPITLREGARLQSFPDDFVFHGSMTSIARQIGNAVPPKLARAVADAIAVRLS